MTACAIEITDSPAVPNDAVDLVKDAIIDAFSGLDGGPRARIGGTLYAARFVGPIVQLGAWAANIVSLKIGLATSPTDDVVAVDIDQWPTITAANIAVALVT